MAGSKKSRVVKSRKDGKRVEKSSRLVPTTSQEYNNAALRSRVKFKGIGISEPLALETKSGPKSMDVDSQSRHSQIHEPGCSSEVVQQIPFNDQSKSFFIHCINQDVRFLIYDTIANSDHTIIISPRRRYPSSALTALCKTSRGLRSEINKLMQLERQKNLTNHSRFGFINLSLTTFKFCWKRPNMWNAPKEDSYLIQRL